MHACYKTEPDLDGETVHLLGKQREITWLQWNCKDYNSNKGHERKD